MDLARPICLIQAQGSYLEVTGEGISFLQGLTRPTITVLTLGLLNSQKEQLNSVLVNHPGELDRNNQGVFVWNQSIQINRNDHFGNEIEVDVLFFDCEGIDSDRGKIVNQLLSVAIMLSSQTLLVINEPIENSLEKWIPLVELPTLIQVQKNINSLQVLPRYFPDLGVVVISDQLQDENLLENALVMNPSDPINTTEVKNFIKHYFQKRRMFHVPTSELNNSSNSIQNLLNYIKTEAPLKEIISKPITGSVLCNIAQAFVHRTQKNASAVILRAFERAVAAEARRIKEKYFIEYLDKMNLLEEDLPCDDETLYNEHVSASKQLFDSFDKQLKVYLEQEEVQDERTSLVERIEAYYADLRENNSNLSAEKAKESFQTIFESIKKSEGAYQSNFSVAEVEKELLSCIQMFKDSNQGPSVSTIFSEEITFIIPYLCSIMRDIQGLCTNEKEEVQRELKSVIKQKDEQKLENQKLKQQIEDLKKSYDKILEQRDSQITELQQGVNMRIHTSETRVREQTREIQGLRLELQQAQKERELMIDAEREIYEKRIQDYENRLQRLQTENSRFEQIIDELREEQEKLTNEKNESINELSRRIKLMENQTESPSPRQDSNLLKSLKGYLEDILNKFSREQTANQKYLAQLERVAQLQTELNQFRMREQELKNKLVEEYEEKIYKEKLEKEAINKKYQETLQNQNELLTATQENVEEQIDASKKLNAEREEQIKRLMEEKMEQLSELARREQQLSDQYEVLESYKQEIEVARCDAEDKMMDISRLKTEIAEFTDDNDTLIKVMRAALDVLKNRKGNLSGLMNRIHNDINREQVRDILTRYRIKF